LKHGLVNDRRDYFHDWYLKHRDERIKHNQENREQRAKYNKEYNIKNKLELNALGREYYSNHKEQISDYQKEYNKVNKVKVAMAIRKYYESNQERIIDGRERRKPIIRQHNLELKIDVCTHYGNGVCACIRCGFDDIRALSIDHINGCGVEARKKETAGVSFYRKLKKNNYPSGFQTLCMNCQFIKRIENNEVRKRVGMGKSKMLIEPIESIEKTVIYC
jgi:hypothetical protein